MQPPYQQPPNSQYPLGQYPNTTKYPSSLEPTQAVYNSNYETTERAYFNPYMNNPYELQPPPPPVPKKQRLWLILLILVMLAASGGVGYMLHITSTPTSTITRNYTASDIFAHFDAHPASVQQNISIYAWTNGAYGDLGETEQSSITWADVSGCSGPCDPANYGLWVYNSASDTQAAYKQISNEMFALTPIDQPVTYPTDPAYMVEAGRCLLLGTDAQSQYAHVIQNECV